VNRYAKNFAAIAFILALMFLLRGQGMFGHGSGNPVKKEYSAAWKMVEKQEVVRGTLKKDQFSFETKVGDKFFTDLDPLSETERSKFQDLLRANNVKYSIDRPLISDTVLSFLVTILLPIAFIVVLWIFFSRQVQSGGNQAMSFGRSKAKRLGENVPKVTFEDVAGVEEAKQELEEVVEFLKNPKKFQALGAKIPKGVLLLGPPGCGKTLLARAIAGEAGVPFFHISGSDFVEMFVGVGASRVRDLFETAKANRPSLIFIDEIDAVGRQRGAGLGGGHDEREQTLNQLLVEMDGFDPNTGVILIAATNRPDVLDPALLRPGRFDRRIIVDNPDAVGRESILKVHVRGKPLADDVDVENLARRSVGFSGADLSNLVNEAALLAARRERTQITMDDFNDSIDRVVAGPERRSRLIGEKEKRMVAFHEVGHAMVLNMLEGADPVHKVSILPRGMALGYTMQLPATDKYLTTKTELLDKVAGLLAGRSAEEIVFGQMSTGASNDLEHATEIVRAMVCEYGMSEAIGPLTLGKRHGNPFLGRDLMEDRNYSEEIAKRIDQEVRSIIDSQHQRAKCLLEENREKMDYIASVLLEKETIEQEEFDALMQGVTLADCSPEPRDDASSPAEKLPGDSTNPQTGTNPTLEPGMA